MTPSKRTERKLIKTTHAVARVLSSDFGIRSGYEIVDTSTRAQAWTERTRTTNDIKGTTDAATALRALFARQSGRRQQVGDTIRPVATPASIEVGDVVEIKQRPDKMLVLATAVSNRGISGFELVRASDTMLHDVADPNEVFATARQVSARLSAVVARIDCDSVRLRYAWDDKRPAFVGLDEWAAQTTAVPAAAITYHAGDFVMLDPSDNGGLLDIVQVHRIRSQDVYVRRLKRQALQAGAAFKHDRLLIPDTQLQRISRTAFAPVSKCRVSLLSTTPSSWTCDDFYVTPKDAGLLHAECTPCTEAYRVKRRQVRDTPKLTTMELMCGAGGLSVGLDLSGACETRYAIDMDEDSTRSFKAHHPSATVFWGDAGDALGRAISGRRSPQGPAYPRRGEVDVLAAGPPCQGFSQKNQNACRDAAEKDPRNLLACTVLGWVDHLRPKYLVLENVEGLTMSRLHGRDQGVVKLLIKCLLDLDYAATCGFVQTGSFGCPQTRGRFVLVAARRELVLPQLPQATHQFLGRKASPFSWNDGHGNTHTAERPAGSAALLPAVTVTDAIDDLPVFDWKDPHETYVGPDRIELERERQGIPQLQVIQGQPTGFAKAPYRKPPSNSYQERLRVFAAQNTWRVSQHQTSDHRASQVERVVNVAMRPGANYKSWSQQDVNKPLLLGILQSNRLQNTYFKYERVDGDKYFKTMLTVMAAGDSMLHPTQRRLFTVRECARAQGFPDWIEFHTDAEANLSSAYRQIGNAVPVPLGVAIGKSLIAARMRDKERYEAQTDQTTNDAMSD